jgi:hypothetical protein
MHKVANVAIVMQRVKPRAPSPTPLDRVQAVAAEAGRPALLLEQRRYAYSFSSICPYTTR